MGPAPCFAVLGHPVAHSLSPRMHEAAFAATGRAGRYVACDVPPERLRAALAGLAALGFRGCNCTVPLKGEACRLAQHRSPEVARTGSANTLRFGPSGEVWAETTDGPGLVEALRSEAGWSPAGRVALVLGAGGTARAVASALAGSGAAAVLVSNRTAARAAEVAAALGSPVRVAAGPPGEPAGADLAAADLVVNCTTVGMDGASCPLPGAALERLRPGTLVVDAVYTPSERTPLLAAARARGLPTLGGLPMLAWQAALSWRLWFGETGPAARMLAEARLALAERRGPETLGA
jgi:shikimate dehydrogenase